MVDDLIVYKMKKDHYLVVVNPANREKDFQWMENHLIGNVTVKDVSDSIAQIALQGPKAENILRKIVSSNGIPKNVYSAVFDGSIQGMNCIISKTGYTGENGYEFYISAANGEKALELAVGTRERRGIGSLWIGSQRYTETGGCDAFVWS